MDFKARFVGRTSTITKEGLSCLLNMPGKPIDKSDWREYLAKQNKGFNAPNSSKDDFSTDLEIDDPKVSFPLLSILS